MASTNASGTVLWWEHYTPFGEKLINPAANKDNTGYTGHIDDAASGLTYMQARYYDPKIGRFLSNDPVGFRQDLPQQFNRYSYTWNNPVNAYDPDGQILRSIVRHASRLSGAAVAVTKRAANETVRFAKTTARAIVGDNTVYFSFEVSFVIGVIGIEKEAGIGFDGKTGEIVQFENGSDPNVPIGEQPTAVGLNIGFNFNVGFVRDSSDLTSETLNLSGDFFGGSGSFKIDPSSGEIRGIELGIGLGVGGGTTVTKGQELGRTCVEQSKCGADDTS